MALGRPGDPRSGNSRPGRPWSGDPCPDDRSRGAGPARVPVETAPQRSTPRFPDGADFRIQIPSVEGPAVLRAVLEQAAAEGVTGNRVSQGSGAMLLSEHEWPRWPRWAPTTAWRSRCSRGPARMGHRQPGPVRRGTVPVRADPRVTAAAVRGRRRAARVDCGIRGFLVADRACWSPAGRTAAGDGEIPDWAVWGRCRRRRWPRQPAQRGPAGAARRGHRQRARLHYLGLLAELRAATTLPIDLYVEAPSSMGGVVRGHEASELVAVASPMQLKFGLRNSRPPYPSGLHLGGRGGRHRPGEGAPGPGGAGMDGTGGWLELVQSGPGARAWASLEPAPDDRLLCAKGPRRRTGSGERRAQRGARRKEAVPAARRRKATQ